VSPPPSRQKRRKRHWDTPASTARSTPGLRVTPNTPRRGALQRTNPGKTRAGGVRLPPSVCSLPTTSGLSIAGNHCRGARRCRHQRACSVGLELTRCEKERPSSRQLGVKPFAGAIRTVSSPRRCRRGTHLDRSCPRRQRELETSSRSQSPGGCLGSPPARPLPMPGSHPAPEVPASPADSDRVANDPHPAPEATGRHGLPCPRRPPKRPPPNRHECRPDGNESAGSSSPEGPSPDRGAHGLATRFAPHWRSPNEGGSSMLPPTVTRRHRWIETTLEEARSSRSLRDADKRAATTFRPDAARCNGLLRSPPPEGRDDWRLPHRPNAGPLPRQPPATHSTELHGSVATTTRSAHPIRAPSHPGPPVATSALVAVKLPSLSQPRT
jgi:hypothetical protein